MTRTLEMGELINLFTERLENSTDYDFMLAEINAYHKKDGTWGSKENAKTYSLTKRAKKHLAKDSEVEIGRGRVTKNGKVSAKFGMNTGSPDKQCGRLTIQGDKKPKTRRCRDYPQNYGSVKEEEVLLASPDIPSVEEPENQTTIHPKIKSNPVKKGIRVRIGEKKRAKKKEPKEREHRRKERIFNGYDDLRRLAKGITENEQSVKQVTLDEFEKAIRRFLKNAIDSERQLFFDSMERLGLYTTERINKVCNRAGYRNTEEWLKFQNSLATASRGELFKKD